jgi:hypothetical protein
MQEPTYLTVAKGKNQTAEDYLEQIRGWADAIEYHGGSCVGVL